MKRVIAVLLLACRMALPLGAATAPVVPTNNFYINDYANALYTPHRDTALALARDLYETTGIQAVILTVKNLSGYTLEDYGRDTVQGWDIGAPDGKGVLLLASIEDNASRLFVGEGLPSLAGHRDDWVDFSTGNHSRAIIEVYRDVVRDAYAASGVTPSEEIAGLLENPDAKTSGPFTTGTAIFLAVIIICVARGYRVTRKYQKKYLKGHVRPVKTYTRTGDLEEDYFDQTIRRTDFDEDDQ